MVEENAALLITNICDPTCHSRPHSSTLTSTPRSPFLSCAPASQPDFQSQSSTKNNLHPHTPKEHTKRNQAKSSLATAAAALSNERAWLGPSRLLILPHLCIRMLRTQKLRPLTGRHGKVRSLNYPIQTTCQSHPSTRQKSRGDFFPSSVLLCLVLSSSRD